MKQRLVVLAFLAVLVTLRAELRLNPDPDTLWIEDGRKIAVSEDQWQGKWWNRHLSVSELPDGGGFSLKPRDGMKNQTLHYVPVSEKYPWLEFSLAQASYQKGYVGLSVFFSTTDINRLGLVTLLNAGTYAFRPFQGVSPEGRKALMVYLYGAEVHFKYIKGVKEPKNYVYADCPALAGRKHLTVGDRIRFIVKMEKSAEDVTVKLYDPYMMKPLSLNAQDKIQLRPSGENACIWTAEAVISSLEGGSKYDSLMMKAVVLGSETVKEPLWGPVFAPFRK